jgi:hypothetical protein
MAQKVAFFAPADPDPKLGPEEIVPAPANISVKTAETSAIRVS